MALGAAKEWVWCVAALLCAPLAFSGAAAPDVRVDPSRGLPGRESLTYAIEWRLIAAGRAQLDWAARDAGFEASLKLESTGLVSTLFRVNDTYSARLRRDLCSLTSHIDAQEGRRRRDTNITFNPDAGKASYVEKDLVRNTVTASQQIDIPPCVHDIVGGLYKLRTLQLEPGQNAQVPVSDGKKSVSARVEAQQREDVRTPAGTFKTVRYEAFLFNDVLYRRSAHLYVWLTDDARKLPVQIRIRMQLTVGTITLQLEKEQHS